MPPSSTLHSGVILNCSNREANAREAVKQAALDRVRADIASMRTTNDLEKITPLIWNELTIIGIHLYAAVFLLWTKPWNKSIHFYQHPMERQLLLFIFPIQRQEIFNTY
ncbi:MAG: hypothetical protein WDM90_05065 [Ferruginibacter sp.]